MNESRRLTAEELQRAHALTDRLGELFRDEPSADVALMAVAGWVAAALLATHTTAMLLAARAGQTLTTEERHAALNARVWAFAEVVAEHIRAIAAAETEETH